MPRSTIRVHPGVIVETERPTVAGPDPHGAGYLVEYPVPGPPYVWLTVDGRRIFVPVEHHDTVCRIVAAGLTDQAEAELRDLADRLTS